MIVQDFHKVLIYTLSNGDRGQTGNINTASDGLFNHNVNGWKLLDGSDHTDEAMLKLGWEKFYLHIPFIHDKNIIDTL